MHQTPGTVPALPHCLFSSPHLYQGVFCLSISSLWAIGDKKISEFLFLMLIQSCRTLSSRTWPWVVGGGVKPGGGGSK